LVWSKVRIRRVFYCTR